MTWCPTSAKQVPVTSPTYPVPIIARFISVAPPVMLPAEDDCSTAPKFSARFLNDCDSQIDALLFGRRGIGDGRRSIRRSGGDVGCNHRRRRAGRGDRRVGLG